MNCNHAIELLDSYVKGTATENNKKALESHLKTCKTCQKQLELYRVFISDATKIEDDFPVPSQLNAKIKYTIQQARETRESKKIPFWMNKQLLSTATACAFLLVAGIWGASNYTKLQNAAGISKIETASSITTNQVTETAPKKEQAITQAPTPSPAVMAKAKQVAEIPDNSATNEAITQDTVPVPQLAEEPPVLEASDDISAYSGGADANATDAAKSETALMQRRMVPTEDATISSEWKEVVLATFPHEILSEDTFLVTATKADLEALMGCSVDADETKTQLTIRFLTLEH